MKIKIALLFVISMTLISLSSCSVSIGGHGRGPHPPRVHHMRGHGGDHD